MMTGKNVLILGNGFDLALGYQTKYSDFAKSKYWSFSEYPDGGLEKALVDAKNQDKWFDVERVLEEYATSSDSYEIAGIDEFQIEQDKKTFDQLCQDLTEYLKSIFKSRPYLNSLPTGVLNRVVSSCSFIIYTFNYTPLDYIAHDIGINAQVDFNYVHGNLIDGIILGVREGAKLKEGYDFLRKTFSHEYKSSPIPYDLQEADSIIFFGHSLSNNDAHYFRQFFTDQMQDNMLREQSKKILFFTFNEDSERDIKRQLSSMCDGRLDKLYTHNNIHFILTKNGAEFKDKEFLNNYFSQIH